MTLRPLLTHVQRTEGAEAQRGHRPPSVVKQLCLGSHLGLLKSSGPRKVLRLVLRVLHCVSSVGRQLGARLIFSSAHSLCKLTRFQLQAGEPRYCHKVHVEKRKENAFTGSQFPSEVSLWLKVSLKTC